jgi:hypothetical protein
MIEEFGCTGYTGVTYLDSTDEGVPFAMPDESVALNTIVYVRGQGLSVRVVSVPGSMQYAWRQETSGYDVCECSPPAVWHFTGYDPETQRIVSYDTLDVHEALHMMAHPDHMFDGGMSGGGLVSELRAVPAGLGLVMVMTEMTDYLDSRGVAGMRGDGELSYDDVAGFDVDSFVADIFGKEE